MEEESGGTSLCPWRTFLPEQFQSLEEYAHALCDFAESPVATLMRTATATRFLLDDTFHKLPPEWIPHLEALSLDQLAHLPLGKHVEDEWPQSLVEFVRAGHDLVVRRVPNEGAMQQLESEIPDLKSQSALSHAMKAKKFQESKTFAPLVARFARALGVSHAVDIGAGKGYFSQLLAFCFDMQVVGVDINEKLTAGAAQRLAHVATLQERQQQRQQSEVPSRESSGSSSSSEAAGGSYSPLTIAVGPETPPNVLFEGANPSDGYLLVGMHCCGNLTPNMLRIFAQQPALTGMMQLGCCYHKLTEEDEVLLPAVRRRDGVVDSGSSAGSVLGFPLSRVVQERHTKLMETGRREACHSCERWPVTLDACEQAYKMHLYRTMLQVVLDRYYAEDLKVRGRDVAVGTIRKSMRASFALYAEECIVKKLQLSFDRVTPEQLHEVEAEFSGRGHEIQIFWTLRGVLGRVLESLILVDRLLYLQENVVLLEDQCLFTTVVPAFHPVDSPRNMAIVCARYDPRLQTPHHLMRAIDTSGTVPLLPHLPAH